MQHIFARHLNFSNCFVPDGSLVKTNCPRQNITTISHSSPFHPRMTGSFQSVPTQNCGLGGTGIGGLYEHFADYSAYGLFVQRRTVLTSCFGYLHANIRGDMLSPHFYLTWYLLLLNSSRRPLSTIVFKHFGCFSHLSSAPVVFYSHHNVCTQIVYRQKEGFQAKAVQGSDF